MEAPRQLEGAAVYDGTVAVHETAPVSFGPATQKTILCFQKVPTDKPFSILE